MKKITVYSADYCGYCRATKDWLAKHQLSYTELDITNNEIQEEFQKYKIPGIPLILVTDEETDHTIQIRGFNIGELTEALF
ncbi:glutaredoxin family protein [Cytobacillus firmus]|nr:glutaredoxin family protein [Cytobacillus firmus]